MRNIQPKTLTPLLMLRILEEYSDEKHPLTREEIERILDEEYGIAMERKAFFRHIKTLQELTDEGIYVYRTTVKSKDPDESKCAGFYLGDRKFNELELRIIIDALSGSRYLSQKETEELVKQLASLGNRYFQRKMKAYQFIGHSSKTENKNLMLDLEIIDEAISEAKQISFDTLCINSRGEQVVADRPKVVCTPIRYFVKDRNYYLVVAKTVDADLLQYKSFSFQEGDLQLEAYILSNVANVEKLDLPAQDYRSLPEFRQGMDWQKLLREHPTMQLLWYKPELCTFLCVRNKIEDIRTRYGDDLRIRQLNDVEFEKINALFKEELLRDSIVEVSVITDRYDAAEFAQQYSFGLWVIAPKPARAIARSLFVSQLERYDWLEQHYITGKKLPPLNLSYTPVNAPQEDS